MRKPMDIDFDRCTSGIEFEEWVKELLGRLRMKADRVEEIFAGTAHRKDYGEPVVITIRTPKHQTNQKQAGRENGRQHTKTYKRGISNEQVCIVAAVNGIHSQIENQYMALFIWLWQHKGLPLADKELLLKRTTADRYDYAENYDKIKVRPMDINTKGEFPLVV